jgi:hypothetical protein
VSSSRVRKVECARLKALLLHVANTFADEVDREIERDLTVLLTLSAVAPYSSRVEINGPALVIDGKLAHLQTRLVLPCYQKAYRHLELVS